MELSSCESVPSETACKDDAQSTSTSEDILNHKRVATWKQSVARQAAAAVAVVVRGWRPSLTFTRVASTFHQRRTARFPRTPPSIADATEHVCGSLVLCTPGRIYIEQIKLHDSSILTSSGVYCARTVRVGVKTAA